MLRLLPDWRIEQLQGCNSSANQDSIKAMNGVVNTALFHFSLLLENPKRKIPGLGRAQGFILNTTTI
jgi:hypothetical protein